MLGVSPEEDESDEQEESDSDEASEDAEDADEDGAEDVTDLQDDTRGLLHEHQIPQWQAAMFILPVPKSISIVSGWNNCAAHNLSI